MDFHDSWRPKGYECLRVIIRGYYVKDEYSDFWDSDIFTDCSIFDGAVKSHFESTKKPIS